MIVSTEYQSEHQDWHLPDEEEALMDYLEELDNDLCVAGPLTEQVEEVRDFLFTQPSGTLRLLTLPVTRDADITIKMKTE